MADTEAVSILIETTGKCRARYVQEIARP